MTRATTALIVLASLIASACQREDTRAQPVAASTPVVPASVQAAPGAPTAAVAIADSATGPAVAGKDAPHVACDTIAVLLRTAAATFGDSATAISSPRDTTDDFRSGPEAACGVTWRNTTTRGWPLKDVYARLDQSGWKRRPGLVQADGPGSEALAFSRSGAACVVYAETDTEDDADSTYVPKPGFVLTVTCYRDRPDFFSSQPLLF